jgi:hypothetical protein
VADRRATLGWRCRDRELRRRRPAWSPIWPAARARKGCSRFRRIEFGLIALSVSPNLVTEISGEMGGSLLHAAREQLRALRSLRRSLKGLRIVTSRKLLHYWHRRRFGIRDR